MQSQKISFVKWENVLHQSLQIKKDFYIHPISKWWLFSQINFFRFLKQNNWVAMNQIYRGKNFTKWVKDSLNYKNLIILFSKNSSLSLHLFHKTFDRKDNLFEMININLNKHYLGKYLSSFFLIFCFFYIFRFSFKKISEKHIIYFFK